MSSCVSSQKHKLLSDKVIDLEVDLGRCKDKSEQIRITKFSLQEARYKLDGCQRRLILCDKMYSSVKSQCYD